MFLDSKFNYDINRWNIVSLEDITSMFYGSGYLGRLFGWLCKRPNLLIDENPIDIFKDSLHEKWIEF
jgi:hypothetical protein